MAASLGLPCVPPFTHWAASARDYEGRGRRERGRAAVPRRAAPLRCLPPTRSRSPPPSPFAMRRPLEHMPKAYNDNTCLGGPVHTRAIIVVMPNNAGSELAWHHTHIFRNIKELFNFVLIFVAMQARYRQHQHCCSLSLTYPPTSPTPRIIASLTTSSLTPGD